MKNIILFGIYDPEYSRNSVLIQGFKENGWSVVQCRVDPKEYRGLSKYIQLIKLRRDIKKSDIILVAFPGHTVMWLARILFPDQKIIFDAFLSRFDSNVNDRKVYSTWSLRGCLDWLLDWSSCALANKILLDTEEHINYFHKTFYIKKNKMIRVLVGTNPLIFHPNSKNNNSSKFIVYFHGMFIPLQGLKYIVEAADLLRNENEIVFQIVGRGQQYNEISKMVIDKKLTNVSLLGIKPLEMLPEYISEASICLGIFGETDKADRVISNKIYEYIAMKKAVITSDTRAIKELFTNERDMLLCKRADGKSLSEAIMRLKNDRQMISYLAENSYNYFNEKMQPRMIVSDLLKSL